MKRFIFLFIIQLLSVFVSFAQTSADYKLKIQDFNDLTVVDGINVNCYCRPDSAGWAVFSCAPELASQIMFTNKAERLSIRTAADEAPIDGMPTVTVYCTVLAKVENSGDSLTRVFDVPEVKDFKCRQIGNGKLEVHGVNAANLDAGITAGKGTLYIKGEANKAKYSNVSSGKLDASDVSTVYVNTFVFGTGDIYCTPVERLRIYGAGTGQVLYTGNIEKITNRSIGVKAVQYNKE
ncbi:MAG: DUF2807 domain-containing protein [Muribaculaceae bacterium]|nr:DUF2807 domain-containing protein [Muribaculaceae bacterium]